MGHQGWALQWQAFHSEGWQAKTENQEVFNTKAVVFSLDGETKTWRLVKYLW